MKEKIQLEFILNVSPKLLYPRISTPGGLSEWFADDVNLNGDIYSFIWKKSEQQAKLLASKDQKYVKFKWLDETQADAFFEFKIETQEVSGEIAMIITDFADSDEIEDVTSLWDSQIKKLKRVLGA